MGKSKSKAAEFNSLAAWTETILKSAEQARGSRTESEELMADHGTGITDGLVSVERTKTGFLVALDGMKFELGTGVGEELLYRLTKALRPYAGYSIFDELMLQLDAILDRLMAGEPADDGRDPGRAEAYTMALATIRNPHAPDYKKEKDRQMERWEKRNDGEIG